jgi:hypothetical protein
LARFRPMHSVHEVGPPRYCMGPKVSGARSVVGCILRPLTKPLASWRRRIPRRVIASTARRPRKADQRTPQRTRRVRSGTIGSTATGSSASFHASRSRDNGSQPGFWLLIAALHFALVFWTTQPRPSLASSCSGKNGFFVRLLYPLVVHGARIHLPSFPSHFHFLLSMFGSSSFGQCFFGVRGM